MKIVAFAGGVGGAKLAQGLAQTLPPKDLTIIVNTGDDFEHLGLYICPDLDTVCYTLGGLANPETGWGRAGETWNTIANIEKLGGPAWFRLGDSDIATHLERTRRLKEGKSLSEITKEFCKAWGIEATVLPMTDSPVRTMVDSDEGELAFQEYFVHRQCQPRVKGFRFDGVEVAEPAQGVREALASADAIIFCPSNPWVSIDPILSVVKEVNKPVFAVSPIIGGKTVKGPAAKMYSELGIEPSAYAVAKHYRTILKGFVLDTTDAAMEKEIQDLGFATLVTNTLMNQLTDRARLANDVLNFIRSL
ncbi:MAG TPA: 2-phospho-L-lactate transferase [Anaerolineales bacterium]|nr:2-phospho-L-lactate transferase [Anaerolineales bacterium]